MLDAVRRPEYTGDRRCWPCTVLNAVVVVGVAALVGAWVPLLSVPVLAVGAAAIWLRGYVVPYTPRFAPPLAAAAGLDGLFHDATPPPEPSSLAPEAVDGEELLADLVAAGALEPEGETLALAPAFAERWEAEMADLRALDTAALTRAAAEVAVAAESRVQRDGAGDREWVVLSDGSGQVQNEHWLTRPVAVAETAAARALGDDLPPARRAAAAGALRMFLEECPDCGTPLEETTTMDCCGGHTGPGDVPADVIACPACDARLYTFEDRTGHRSDGN